MNLYSQKDIIEMCGGHQTAISPQLKLIKNHINVDLDDIKEACHKAFNHHSKRSSVIKFKEDFEINCANLYKWYMDGSYVSKIQYRQLFKINKNGKTRNIDSPNLTTRIYQHLVLLKLGQLYYSKDNLNGLNCKPECGITASDRAKSVVKKLKHIYFDRLDLKYCLIIDQRKCYDHVKIKAFRKFLKRLISDKKFIDFVVDVCFVSGKLPIGTPTSPFVHHILMMEFDNFVKNISPFSIRYADDNFLAFYTKEDANSAKWRIKNYWWYVLGIRSKRHTCVITSMDTPVDFCGYVFHRNNKGVSEHNKGYVRIRNRVAKDARKCITNESWASYFGLLKHCDSYSLMSKIENTMKLRDLTSAIRIDKSMDADNIDIKNLEGIVFDIIDYDIRRNNKNEPNWIKCLIGIKELDEDGLPTGKRVAREFHGNYQSIVSFISKCESNYGKDSILPITDVEIENRCGYVLKGSTNRIAYID